MIDTQISLNKFWNFNKLLKSCHFTKFPLLHLFWRTNAYWFSFDDGSYCVVFIRNNYCNFYILWCVFAKFSLTAPDLSQDILFPHLMLQFLKYPNYPNQLKIFFTRIYTNQTDWTYVQEFFKIPAYFRDKVYSVIHGISDEPCSSFKNRQRIMLVLS